MSASPTAGDEPGLSDPPQVGEEAEVEEGENCDTSAVSGDMDELASSAVDEQAAEEGEAQDGVGSTDEGAESQAAAMEEDAGLGEEGEGAAQHENGGTEEEGEVATEDAGDGGDLQSPGAEAQEAFDADAEEGEIVGEMRQPEPGTEIFVGGLSKAATSEEVRKLFSEHGEVAEVRIMVDRKTSVPRGYGFVRYMTKESAQKAIESANGHQLHGKALEVGPSGDNRRLAVSNLDVLWNAEEFKTLLQLAFKNIKGVIDMELREDDSGGPNKNMGMGYIQFESHAAAKDALNSFTNGTVMVAGRPLQLEFARHERGMHDKRTIYVAKLPPDVKKEELEEVFKKFGTIVKLYVAVLDSRQPLKGRSDYGFVAFDNDKSFQDALTGAQNAVIRGHRLEVSRAKQSTRSSMGRDGRGMDGRRGMMMGRPGFGGGGMGGARLPYEPPRMAHAGLGPRGIGSGVGSLAVDGRPVVVPPPLPPAPFRDYHAGGRGPPPPVPGAGYYPPGPPAPYEDRKRRGRSAEYEDPQAKRGRPSRPPMERGPYDDHRMDRGGPPPPPGGGGRGDDWDSRGPAGRGGPGGYRQDGGGGGGRDMYRRGPPRDDGYGRGGDERYRRDDYRGGGNRPAYGEGREPGGGGGGGYDRYPPREPARGGGDYGRSRSPYGREPRDRAPSPYGPAAHAPPPSHYPPAGPPHYGRSGPYDHRAPPPQPYDYPPQQQPPSSYQYGGPRGGPPPSPAPPSSAYPPARPAASSSLQPSPMPYPATGGVTTGPRGPVSAGPSSLVPPPSKPASNKLMPPGMASQQQGGGAKKPMLMPPGAKSLQQQQQQSASAGGGARPASSGANGNYPPSHGRAQPPHGQGYGGHHAGDGRYPPPGHQQQQHGYRR